MVSKSQVAKITIGYLIIGATAWALSYLINPAWDWKYINLLNPDGHIPILDEVMILITDYSIALFAIWAILWQVGFRIYFRNRTNESTIEEIKVKIRNGLRAFGLPLGLGVISAYFWTDNEYNSVFIAFGIIFFIGVWFLSATFTDYDQNALDRLNLAFWMSIVAIALNSLAESVVKDIVMRPRPLNEINSGMNGSLRTFADELVRGSYSYFSGHSSGLFALTTPFLWTAQSKAKKTGILLWAMSHAFSRVYLVAHFPFDVIVGSLVGFSIGTLVYLVLKKD